MSNSARAWERELGSVLTSAQVRELLGGVPRDRHWTAASWRVSPDEALEGRDPARLARIARQDAARLAQ